MKTAVSLPDRLFRDAEQHARRARKTRSQLYADALAEYLARHAPDEVTEAMNRVVDAVAAAPDAAGSPSISSERQRNLAGLLGAPAREVRVHRLLQRPARRPGRVRARHGGRRGVTARRAGRQRAGRPAEC